jgi:cell division protein FtsW (lipid II flippase)
LFLSLLVFVVLFDLTLRDVLFLFSTRLDVSSSSSSSSSCRRRRRRRLRRRRRQHSKHTIPWCDCPLGSSPNGALASCVFASSYITTWLKAQDGGGPPPILLSKNQVVYLVIVVVVVLFDSTPFDALFFLDSTRRVVLVVVVVCVLVIQRSRKDTRTVCRRWCCPPVFGTLNVDLTWI